MIPFHTVTMQDRNWVTSLLQAENSRSADHSFSNIYMWDDSYHQEIAEVSGCLGIRLSYDESPFYAYPVGGGDTRGAILQLKEDACSLGVPLKLRGMLKEHLPLLEREFPGEFTLTEDRFVFDYLYDAEKLASLAGKKLQPKRNYANRFQREHPGWHFEPVTEETLPLCRAFQARWLREHGEDDQYTSENLALARCFANFTVLDMEGGILFAEDRVIGYTLGEKLNCDTFDVHFEKADPEISGSYAMVNREFVRLILARHPEIRYINREDDMGLENLRKAKLSYVPAAMVEKYTATWRE